jgi:heme/copper-type cytochrome/quinol oxidase subunit 2
MNNRRRQQEWFSQNDKIHEHEEVLFLKPKKFNLHILKQFFYLQMIPFYGIRFVLFALLGLTGIDFNIDQATLDTIHWIAIFMCLYIIGSALVHNCYFLVALYWAEHVSYHHGLGLVVVEAKMKTSRVIFVVFSVLWLVFELVICGLTIYFVLTLRAACFKYLRILLHIQYGFDLFLSTALAGWFLVFAYIRKKSLFNWNTELDTQSSDAFIQRVKKKRRETFVATIICILLFLFQSLFSLVYFEIYNGIFNVANIPPSKHRETEQMKVLLGYWITKGMIDLVAEIVSFILYFVFTYDELDESNVGSGVYNDKPFTFLRKTAFTSGSGSENNSLLITPVTTHRSTVGECEDTNSNGDDYN